MRDAAGESSDLVLPDRRLERVARSDEAPARAEGFVAGVCVAARAGGFDGGRVTPEIVGTDEGEPETRGW